MGIFDNDAAFGEQAGTIDMPSNLPPLAELQAPAPTTGPSVLDPAQPSPTGPAALVPDQYLPAPLPMEYVPTEELLRTDALANWNSRFAFEVALILENSGDPLQEVMDRNKVSYDMFKSLGGNAAFNRAVNTYRNSIRTEGITFKMRCRVLADIWLQDLDQHVIRNPDASAASKVSLFQHITQVAELVPNNKPTAGEIAAMQNNASNNFAVNIVLGSRGEKAPRVIEVEKG